MSIITSQQISRFYETYRNLDVTFNKEVIRATGLFPRQVFLKCLGDQWPCIVYSSSMVGARVVVNIQSSFFEKVRKANSLLSLRFSFKQNDKTDPLSFYVAARMSGSNPFGPQNPDLNFVTLTFTQRPPDDLIEILGKLLEANINSKRRKEERIVLSKDSMRRMGIKMKDSMVHIQGVPRKCIIRDLSFSGMKLIIVGVAKFLVDKDALIRLEFDDPPRVLELKGRIIRFEAVEGRKDLAAVAVQLDEQSVPMEYKMIINEYLTQLKKSSGE